MDTYPIDRPHRHESTPDKPPSYTEIVKGPMKTVKRSDNSNNSQHPKQDGEIRNLFQKILHNSKDPDSLANENILLIGLPGAGKSALLCTLNAALTGKYTPWMRQGRGVAQTNTIELRRFKRCGIREFDLERNTNKTLLRELWQRLPHFWDFAGLGDENSAALREILYLIINGYIPPGTNYRSLEKIQEDYKLDNDVLRMKYDKQHPDWKITTVIFVHSCRAQVPKELINCLLSVLNETDQDSGRTTYNGNVFVVMTKQDLADKPITDRDGEESTHGISADGQAPLVDTSSSDATVAETERQLAAEFNIQGSQTFAMLKLTNYSDDSGYEYDPEIVNQHLKLLYLITLPRHRDEETVTPPNNNMGFKLWLIMSTLYQNIRLILVVVFAVVIVYIIIYGTEL